ncbi:hypothetical protein DFJ73DRAFT_850528 [Zopfochytrium polystomum]|nr:hypothetical protein DFJ73DRAFT_850528 [Zopfochytrium polystomum]
MQENALIESVDQDYSAVHTAEWKSRHLICPSLVAAVALFTQVYLAGDDPADDEDDHVMWLENALVLGGCAEEDLIYEELEVVPIVDTRQGAKHSTSSVLGPWCALEEPLLSSAQTFTTREWLLSTPRGRSPRNTPTVRSLATKMSRHTLIEVEGRIPQTVSETGSDILALGVPTVRKATVELMQRIQKPLAADFRPQIELEFKPTIFELTLTTLEVKANFQSEDNCLASACSAIGPSAFLQREKSHDTSQMRETSFADVFHHWERESCGDEAIMSMLDEARSSFKILAIDAVNLALYRGIDYLEERIVSRDTMSELDVDKSFCLKSLVSSFEFNLHTPPKHFEATLDQEIRFLYSLPMPASLMNGELQITSEAFDEFSSRKMRVPDVEPHTPAPFFASDDAWWKEAAGLGGKVPGKLAVRNKSGRCLSLLLLAVEGLGGEPVSLDDCFTSSGVPVSLRLKWNPIAAFRSQLELQAGEAIDLTASLTEARKRVLSELLVEDSAVPPTVEKWRNWDVAAHIAAKLLECAPEGEKLISRLSPVGCHFF